MAQSSWPFENIDTSETQFSQWARQIGEGIRKDYSSELEVTADGSGMSVDVLAGQALVRGHYYDNSATETVTIPNADLTNPRIDTVVLRLDPSANSIVLAVVQGTPASSPVAPSLTQSEANVYELPLADVAVAAAAVVISSGNLTDRRLILTPVSDKQDIITGAASTITSTNLTAGRALISNGSGKVAVSSTISDTELGYLDGVTSGIQAQLNGKSPLAGSASITTVGTVTTVTSPTAAGSAGLRKTTISTADPSGGADGDVWLKYS
jgi:hypothetical protein